MTGCQIYVTDESGAILLCGLLRCTVQNSVEMNTAELALKSPQLWNIIYVW